jgi:hypothetical protein
MEIEIKTWLYDILNAIAEIDSFFKGQSRDFEFIKTILRREGLLSEILKLLVRQQTVFFKRTLQ